MQQVENIKTAWLGDVPNNWDVLRIKNVFQEVENRSETGSEELLSVSHYTGITKKRESLENEDDHITNAKSLIGYKLVEKDDLVINIMLAWNGSLGISKFDGITSPAYCVYRIKNNYNPDYFGYLFTTNLFKAEFRRYSTGIIDSRLRLYPDKFYSIFCLVPPISEQNKITKYLDHKTQQIENFIAKKLKFIELLKEQRQSIINDEVTKNIGDWSWMRLKDVCTINDETLTDKTDNDYLIKYIDIGNVNSYGDIAELQDYTFDKAPSRARRIVKKGDVIISTVRTYLKAISLIDSEEDNIIASTGFAVLRPNKSIISEYLNLALRAEYFIASVIKNSYGVSYPAINSTILGSLKILIPNTINEQNEILIKIKAETATIDTAIAKTQKEIELIKEYKEALISEAVTGKKIV